MPWPAAAAFRNGGSRSILSEIAGAGVKPA